MTDDQTTPTAAEIRQAISELSFRLSQLEATPNADEVLIAHSGAVEKVLTGVRELLHKIG